MLLSMSKKSLNYEEWLKMQDLENMGPGKWLTKSQGRKMQDQIILPVVEYVLIHWTTNSYQTEWVLTNGT